MVRSPKYLWKERIQPLYSDLVRILPIEPILDKLLSTDQVKLEEFDKLKQMSGDVERARYILRNVLPYRGNKGFYKFCETLSEAGGYDQILHLIQPERHPGYDNNRYIVDFVYGQYLYCMQIHAGEAAKVPTFTLLK